MNSTQEKDRRIALAIMQMEKWKLNEKQDNTLAEAIANTKPTKRPRARLVVERTIAPIERMEKIAIIAVLSGCANAVVEHLTGTDWVHTFFGPKVEHIFWIVVLVSGIYTLGIFNDLLKTRWKFETKAGD